MATFTDSPRAMFTNLPEVHRSSQGSHWSVDTATYDGTEQYPTLGHSQRSQPMSSVHFLLAHEPSRLKQPGRIVERKREHAYSSKQRRSNLKLL